jgi:uncharacterized protein (TIGR02453 family)
MLEAATLKFLKELEKNNNKAWFEKNRLVYETAKSDFIEVITELLHRISKFEPAMGSLLAKDCLFRINRDVRFSKDKRPYKNNMAGYFNKDGKKGPGAGYYLHVEPGKSFVAGGIWMPEAAGLAKIRQEIDYCFAEWKKIIGSSGFKKLFPKGLDTSEILIRPPKGYDENNPAIAFLKMKSFVVRKPITNGEIQSKSFVKDIARTFETMKPMIDFINKAVG